MLPPVAYATGMQTTIASILPCLNTAPEQYSGMLGMERCTEERSGKNAQLTPGGVPLRLGSSGRLPPLHRLLQPQG